MNASLHFRQWFTRTIITLIGTVVVSVPSSAMAVQQTAPARGQLLQKSASAVEPSVANATSRNIIVRLYGLHSGDLVNIRPKGVRLSASAGSLVKTLRINESAAPEFKLPYDAISPGPPLPDSAMQVTPAAVTFLRPAPFDGTVFLDIEVPDRSRVQVFVDEELVLTARLRQPLAFRNGEWGEGALGISGTTVRAAMPLIGEQGLPEQSVYDRSKGTYVVPFSKLQVLTRTRVTGEESQSVVVVVQIDETGRVVKVIPLTNAPPVDLESNLKQWRFVPYEIEGRAVPVTTTLKLTVKKK